MYDGGKIIVGLMIGLALLLFPVYYNAGRAAKAPEPVLSEKAKEAKQCMAEKSYMRPEHMKMLDQWRHEAVRLADRYYKGVDGKVYYKSLQVTCMECHSNKSTFCDQCHNYLGVAPFCWDCHITPKENG